MIWICALVAGVVVLKGFSVLIHLKVRDRALGVELIPLCKPREMEEHLNAKQFIKDERIRKGKEAKVNAQGKIIIGPEGAKQ